MAKKLYVGNLSYTVDSSELEQLFAQHGQVVSAQIINDRDTGGSASDSRNTMRTRN